MNTTYRQLISKTSRIVAAASCSAMLMSPMANATVISSESSAYSLVIELGLDTALVNLDLNIIAPTGASGTAPAPYLLNDSVLGADVDLSAGVLEALSLATLADTTLLEASASSDVDGLAGDKTTNAETTVNDLGLSLINTLLPLGNIGSAVSIGASTIFSEAQVSGDYGSFTATGNSYVEDLGVDLFGLGSVDFASLGFDVDVDGKINSAPNFVIADINSIVGLNLTLNEQSSNCTALECSISVNALNLSFNAVDLSVFDLGLSGTIDGSVIIGHSEASMTASASATAVPAPPTLWLFGLLGLGFALKARKNKAQRV